MNCNRIQAHVGQILSFIQPKCKISAVLFLLMIFCHPILTPAQSGDEDVVYLKNGSILRGEIVERTPGETIKLQMVGHNVLVINLDEVEKINREKAPESTYYKEAGYTNHTGVDILQSEDGTTVRYQMVNGYQFSPVFSLGLGVGFTPYNDPLAMLPVFLDGRYKFGRANTSPFLFVRSGYSFSILSDENNQNQVEDHRGGLILNPGIGIEFHTSAGFGWYLSAGLNLDNSSFEYERWDGRIVETDISYRRVQFGFGLIF